MLKTKLQFLGFDKTGRILKIKDSTGLYSTDNPTGYSTPNTNIHDIEEIIFTIKHYDDAVLYTAKFVRDFDPNNLNNFVDPSIEDITGGQVLELTSQHFGITDLTQGINAFKDGVYDINMYTVLEDITGIVATEGMPFITGTGLQDIYDNYTSIVIDDVIYNLNRTMPTNNGTVLYLLEDLQTSSTSFKPVHRANIKGYNSTQAECLLKEAIGRLDLCGSGCKCDDSIEDLAFKINMYKISSQILFNSSGVVDYKKINDMLVGAYNASKGLNCKSC